MDGADAEVPTAVGVLAAGAMAGAPVRHRGWMRAQARLLAALAQEPAFVALLGPAGVGKTWLLHSVLEELRQRGQAATLVPQGDLPLGIAPGSILLVDEAARMDAYALGRLAAVADASVVLTGLPRFAEQLDALSRQRVVVILPPLPAEEVGDFVADWLRAHGHPPDAAGAEAVARLAAHSGGAPRVLVQLLRAALAMAAHEDAVTISAASVDEMAALRLGGPAFEATGPAEPAAAALFPDATDPIAATRPGADGAPEAPTVPAAVAAHESVSVSNTGANAAAPAPASRLRALAARHSGWGVAAGVAAVVAVVALLLPDLRERHWPFHPQAPAAPPVVGLPTPAGPGAAVTLPALPSPGQAAPPQAGLPEGQAAGPAPEPAQPPASADGARRGAPGLVLVAQEGDTMADLYAKVYRGLKPPPYAQVTSINQMPLKPGELVVFPEPPNGWTQR